MVSGNALFRIDKVSLLWALLVSGWVTACGQTIRLWVKYLGTKPAIEVDLAFILCGMVKWVSAFVSCSNRWWVLYCSCQFRWIYGSSWLAWSKGWWLSDAHAALTKWTGWTLAVAVHCYDDSGINIVAAVNVTVVVCCLTAGYSMHRHWMLLHFWNF